MLIGTATLRDGTGTVRSVTRALVHPNYNRGRNDNDFMLLRLNKPVRFSDTVKKIRLPRECPREGMSCTVSGWGTTKSPGGNWLVVVTRGGWRKAIGQWEGLSEEATLSPGLGKHHPAPPSLCPTMESGIWLGWGSHLIGYHPTTHAMTST